MGVGVQTRWGQGAGQVSDTHMAHLCRSLARSAIPPFRTRIAMQSNGPQHQVFSFLRGGVKSRTGAEKVIQFKCVRHSYNNSIAVLNTVTNVSKIFIPPSNAQRVVHEGFIGFPNYPTPLCSGGGNVALE